jgi:hypothetical protein
MVQSNCEEMTMSDNENLLTESSLARIHKHTQGRNIGMITAHRGEYTSDENHARNKSLESDIRHHGFGFVHVHGHYPEKTESGETRHVKEHSYLVIGKEGHDSGALKGFLKKHGSKYDQDSVLHKAHNEPHAKLISTSDRDPDFKKHAETNVGTWHPNRVGDYHSSLYKHPKKTFAFESLELKYPLSFFSRKEYLVD